MLCLNTEFGGNPNNRPTKPLSNSRFNENPFDPHLSNNPLSFPNSNLKWVIDKSYSDDDVKMFLDVLENIILKIKEKGLK